MKHVMIGLAALLLSFGLFYLLGAFYAVSFDIAIWSEQVRGTVAILGGILAIMIAMAAMTASSTNNPRVS